MNIPAGYKSRLCKASTTTILAVGSLCAPWETTKIIGSTILTGIGYGIANELIASWSCSKHFNKRRVLSLDISNSKHHSRHYPIPGLHYSFNAVVNGMLDYWRVSSVVGIILAVVARTPLSILKGKIKATQLTPYLVIGSALITLIIQIGRYRLQKHDTIIACSIQQSASYGILVTGNMLLTAAILSTRIGLKLIK